MGESEFWLELVVLKISLWSYFLRIFCLDVLLRSNGNGNGELSVRFLALAAYNFDALGIPSTLHTYSCTTLSLLNFLNYRTSLQKRF